ncbi:saccharopine dehydrogenase NADP-binding domain-containing protein [Halopseudomonas salegens]|uniref:Saccharopine dehydrogenase, NADP-dependent n=1 Tax=Halopseudomonas salegens TaxID=1434072 RepID=A0A1H2EPW6_9GAMM|nr:saccharopine dehydrogenase NADP-binding domain-containing protein [Halopseudomonas salegens]SDT97170.1 Saccharopine dehydrogenase, NADP-dependent [Halopseudomonas salegens]
MSVQVLLVGGSGVVGSQLARLLGQQHPDLHLIIGGRSRTNAALLADELPNASQLVLDLTRDDPLAQLERLPQLVVTLANDTYDHLLTTCLRHGIPYLDITRWTSHLQRAISTLPALPPARAPVVFASSWMASVTAILASEQAEDLLDSTINIDIKYALNDKAGPNSAHYLDQLSESFTVLQHGQPVAKYAFTDSQRVSFNGSRPIRTYRFDAPDQMTLPLLTAASSVSTRIAFDSALATAGLMLLVRSGLWQAISGQRFSRLRHRLLYNPGSGGSHQIRISVTGQTRDGATLQRVLELEDPYGQSHLTAVGAYIQIQRILGLGGQTPARCGAQYAEACTDPVVTRSTLESLGVHLRSYPPLTRPKPRSTD